MALLPAPPRFHFPLSPPRPSPRRRRFCSAAAGKEEGNAAVVWFKHDLRVDDHPGLVAASSCRTVVPLYVFDHRILSRFSDDMLKHVIYALKDLKKSLKDQGSDLLIDFGPAENAIQKLANEVKATHIYAEQEVEDTLCNMVGVVEESVANASWGSPQFLLWRTPFYNTEDLEGLPSSYENFQKLKLPLTLPLISPSLPELDLAVARGVLPTYDDLKHYISANPCKLEESWVSKKAISAKTILRLKTTKPVGLSSVDESEKTFLDSEKNMEKRKRTSMFLSEKGNEVAGGTDVVSNALAAYLRYLEGTSRDDWQELHEKLRNAESRKGASFNVLFGPALQLGSVSRRKVHYEAIKYEKERNAGFLNPLGYSAPTVAAAVESVTSMEWYWLLALKSQMYNEGKFPIRIWRWNGHLIQYTMTGNEGPALLLVHGFGAFLEHYRDNISSLACSENRIWAITLLGFGKSEKPNISFTELMWAEFLRDFIVDVVGEPVHLVGNSLGGYVVSIVAGFWPSLVKSIVLINTAGSVIPGNSSIQSMEVGETSGAVWLGARLLLLYLRLRARNILKNCYPTNTNRVDDWLTNEILRASYDPGSLIVLESVFSFNLSIPLNYLFGAFGGKVLVIQGMKDPLTKSELKVSMLKEHCSGVSIIELDAGHCPHDETPDEVNLILNEWIMSAERSKFFDNIINRNITWPQIPEEMSYEAHDLIIKLLIENPLQRLGATGAQEVKSSGEASSFFQRYQLANFSKVVFIPSAADAYDTSYFTSHYVWNPADGGVLGVGSEYDEMSDSCSISCSPYSNDEEGDEYGNLVDFGAPNLAVKYSFSNFSFKRERLSNLIGIVTYTHW